MKSIIIISLIILTGLASAYTPEQQTTLDGMNLSFKLGVAYEKVNQGQDATEFNALVDEYNTWIRQHFGEDASLLKSKINEPPIVITPSGTGTQYLTKPFNASSDLSKFGKQQAYAAADTQQAVENAISQQESSTF
jgi:hypothetical protein